MDSKGRSYMLSLQGVTGSRREMLERCVREKIRREATTRFPLSRRLFGDHSFQSTVALRPNNNERRVRTNQILFNF